MGSFIFKPRLASSADAAPVHFRSRQKYFERPWATLQSPTPAFLQGKKAVQINPAVDNSPTRQPSTLQDRIWVGFPIYLSKFHVKQWQKPSCSQGAITPQQLYPLLQYSNFTTINHTILTKILVGTRSAVYNQVWLIILKLLYILCLPYLQYLSSLMLF